MGDNNNMKIKLLKLVEYLKTESSKDNPKSTNEIIAYLESTGTSSERRTLYQDMEFLAENGIDVVKTKKSKENAYYIDSNALSLAELKILIDAVQAANFITDSKTAALVEKLTDLAGIRKREILNENIIFYNNHKHTNEDIFDNIEIIERAIKKKREITFCYFDLDEKLRRIYRKDKQRYHADPIALVYSEDNYYLVTYNRKYEATTNYRVDRMDEIEIEDEPICKEAQVRKGRASVYMKQIFKMYNGETVDVTLEFDRSILGAVYDKFGEDQPVKALNKEQLTTTVTVQISPPFFGWIYQFGDKMSITSPSDLEKQFRKAIKDREKSDADSYLER